MGWKDWVMDEDAVIARANECLVTRYKGEPVRLIRHHPKTIDRAGKRYGRLVAVARVAPYNPSRWLCQCDCGNIHVVRSDRLGVDTHSCGCIRRERAYRKPRGENGQYVKERSIT